MHNRYDIKVVGEQEPTGSRIFFEEKGRRISPWHDIPLYANEANGLLNMVVEIPKGTNAKLEVGAFSENGVTMLLAYEISRFPKRKTTTPSNKIPTTVV